MRLRNTTYLEEYCVLTFILGMAGLMYAIT